MPIAAQLYAEGIPAMSPGEMRVPHKLAQRICKGEFLDLAELLPEKLGQTPDTTNTKAGEGETRKRKRKRVNNAFQPPLLLTDTSSPAHQPTSPLTDQGKTPWPDLHAPTPLHYHHNPHTSPHHAGQTTKIGRSQHVPMDTGFL